MIITFLTDFGLQDDFVGTCHGVIARIAPDARVIDLTHGIPPQAVLQAAIVLQATLPYLPAGVHLAVVDPGVGGDRRAIAVRTKDGRHWVGPDNGLLLLAADELGIDAAHELANPAYRLPHVSFTFHARDIFSPAAAHLAAGVPIEELGPPVAPDDLVRVSVPEPEIGRAQVGATVLAIDRFGNVATNLRRRHLDALAAPGGRVELRFPFERYHATVARAFGDAATGELLLLEDSYGFVTVAINQGNAARLTGVKPGDELRVAHA